MTFCGFMKLLTVCGHVTYQVGVGVTLGLYLGGAVFEFWPGHLLFRQGFCGFPQFLQADIRIVPQLGQDSFLPNPFQFITHLALYSMRC
jgi:hypothetical protein